MRILLDTHTLLWWWLDVAKLSGRALAILRDPATVPVLSPVSTAELAIKIRRGLLRLDRPLEVYVEESFERQGMLNLSLEHKHAARLAELPHHHGDPFDRLLIAQAQVERMPILTVDARFRDYDVEVVW